MAEFLKECVVSMLTPSFTTVAIVVLTVVALLYVSKWVGEFKQSRRRELIDEQCGVVDQGETIFVSIASYRDCECAQTVFDLFEKAFCPFRICVGVCQQNDVGDEDVIEGYKRLVRENGAVGDFSDRIRVIRMAAEDAKGPMYARHLIETNLYNGERYYFVTDSHMLFVPHWDKKVIDEWRVCARSSAKPILTTYPAGFKTHNRTWAPPDFGHAIGSYLRFKKFNERNHMIEIEGPTFLRKPTEPLLGMFWGGCFSFALASMIKEVPFDPHCEYVFFGEEISMSARLWTSGYDFYHPTQCYVYHMWERNRPTFWQQFSDSGNATHQARQQKEAESHQRLESLLNMGNSASTILPPYGLGSVRSLQEYEQFIGIRMGTQELTSLSGIMGVPDKSNASEILCKFGTWKNFEAARETLKKNLVKST